MSVIIEVRSNKLPWLTEEARRRAVLAVAKAAADVEAHAKNVVPVDTGNLKSSIQEQRQPDSDDLTKYVGTGVEYAIYVEYGTYKMRAQPYMRPAADAVRDPFVQVMSRIADV